MMQARKTAKYIVKWLFKVAVFPLFLTFLLISKLSGSDRSFTSFSQALSLIPGKFGVYSRAAFYHLACPDTSDEISIGFLTILSHRDTTIRRGVYVGPQCNIGMCKIGQNTLLGSGVHILSGSRQHAFSDLDRPIQEQGGQFEKIVIGEDCWVGNQATIFATMGNKSIAAAGSVVTTPVAIGGIVAGNPAKQLRNRFDSSQSVDTQETKEGN